MTDPIISIITVTYNSDKTITDTIRSVLAQTYPNIEYIIIDGASDDGTDNIIKSFGDKINKYISEPDRGMYDAINKGFRIASGKVVGILNSDDVFYDNYVIEKVAESFSKNETDALFGDAIFVDPVKTTKIIRYYSSKNFKLSKFRFGYMPAHTSFYAKKELFERYGYYKTDYKIAADFELMLRFLLINKVSYKYLEFPFVVMRMGGISNRTINSKLILNKEIVRACRENGLKTNYLNIYSKYSLKLFEFIQSKKRLLYFTEKQGCPKY